MTAALRLLVLDAYSSAGRADLRRAGATEAGSLYERVLRRLAPTATIDVAHPADPDGAPTGDLARYDGAVWTGSSLTIHVEGDAHVARQIELARKLFALRVPSFGSCFAAQLAVTAAGGACRVSPRGREFGIARAISPTTAGRAHPLLAGRTGGFDAFTSHADEIATLPPHATVLASNDYSDVQAVDVEHAGGSFWAVQYHPEFDLHEVAALCRLRADELVRQGTFADREQALAHADSLDGLHRDPSQQQLARQLDVGRELLDEEQRTAEVKCWLEARVEAPAQR